MHKVCNHNRLGSCFKELSEGSVCTEMNTYVDQAAEATTNNIGRAQREPLKFINVTIFCNYLLSTYRDNV